MESRQQRPIRDRSATERVLDLGNRLFHRLLQSGSTLDRVSESADNNSDRRPGTQGDQSISLLLIAFPIRRCCLLASQALHLHRQISGAAGVEASTQSTQGSGIDGGQATVL